MGKIFTPANASNPMTTLGDVPVGGVGGTPNRLPIGSNGQVATADSTAANLISYQNQFNDYNFIVNSGFDYFQEATTKTVTATGGGTPTASYAYGADQWYVNNILGGGTVEGVITMTKQPFTLIGSGNTFRALITTAPTGTGIQNGLEIYHPLSAAASVNFFGQTASFSIQVLADGNVTQVGLQFYYSTSETKLVTPIGSETLCTVSNSMFTLCAINGQALGGAWGVGIIGVRIRPTAVSSGNLYSLNNGLDLEQAMLNIGPVAHPWHRQNANPALELLACQHFYEKSYSLTTNPATATLIGMLFTAMAGSGVYVTATAQFKTTKRAVPSMSYWDGNANVTKYSTFSGGAWAQTNNVGAVTEITPSQSGFMYRISGTSVAGGVQWVADARI